MRIETAPMIEKAPSADYRDLRENSLLPRTLASTKTGRRVQTAGHDSDIEFRWPGSLPQPELRRDACKHWKSI